MFGRRQLVKDIGAGVGAMVALALAGAASTVVLARLLTVEQFGKVSVLLLSFNLTSTFDAVRPVTIFFANRFADQPRETFSSIFWIDAGIGGALGIALASAAAISAQSFFDQAELLCLAGVFTLFFMQSAYWGWADAHGLVARTALIRALIMILVHVAFVSLAAIGVKGAGYAMVLLVATVAMFGAFWWICRASNLVTTVSQPDPIIMRAIGGEVRRYMQFNLATLVLATVDRIAISLQGGPRALGLYSAHFDLATKPMALARAAQSALYPHITRAAALNSQVFEPIGVGTKTVLAVASVAVWGAVLVRDWLAQILLGPEYGKYQDVFAAVALAQPFVLMGYASALILNSVGNFSLQKTYYLLAAVVMFALVFPAAELTGVFGVAVVYFLVRTVDVWLIHAAIRTVHRKIIVPNVLAAAITWCGASLAAWLVEPVICVIMAAIFVAILWHRQLTSASTNDVEVRRCSK